MLSSFSMLEDIRIFFKNLFEKMMIEERAVYLCEHKETKANGFYTRTINSILGTFFDIEVPRTRDSNFRSALLPKGHSLQEIETLINALFTEGISTRKIEKVLNKCYGTSISHTTISRLALVAYEEVQTWQNRPLSEEYAVIFIDAFYFSIKRQTVAKEAVYSAIGITPEGKREVLGFWIPGGSEGSGNWEEILRGLHSRGVKSVDYIVADGLTGISDVIAKCFPSAKHQYCVVHGVRTCLGKVRAGHKELIAEDMKRIYKAEDRESALQALSDFSLKWEKIYPKVTSFWKNNHKALLAFMDFPRQLWIYVYTTNCLERLHKEIKRRLHVMEQFQSPESAEKILYMLYSEQNIGYSKSGINNWAFAYKTYYLQKAQKISQELEEKIAI